MIHIRHLLTLFFISLLTLNVGAQTLTTDSIEHEVLLETSKGNIRVKLYNDTPIHRDNFLKLVRQGFYDGLLFHRVIPDFMIQAGDSASRHAKEGYYLAILPNHIPYQPKFIFQPTFIVAVP